MQTQMLGAVLSFFAIGLVLELLIYRTTFGWKNKKILATSVLVVTSISTGLFIASMFSAASVLFALLMVYRMVNLLRLVQSRMHDAYLKNVTIKSFVWLAVAQSIAIALWYFFSLPIVTITQQQVFIGVGVSFLLAGIFILVTTIKNLRDTRPTEPMPYSSKDAPTVSVAIAARNETEELTQCLEAVLASDYPKLEIIVLDDCSQDRTADIIKSFAHAGVRFIKGQQPGSVWLAKNRAYQTLLEEATGHLILYLGVDTRIHQTTISQIVGQFKTKKVAMLSIMPKRTKSGLIAAFIQPMRYWWELALPGWIIKHTPVVSTCWIADRNALIKAGGFRSIMRAIIPEEHLSTSFYAKNAYALIRTDNQINLTTHKDFSSQWSTAVRTRYPQAHRRPEIVAMRVVIMLYFLIAPFIVLPMLLLTHLVSISVLLLITLSVIFLIVAHFVIALATNPVTAWLAPINFPVVVAIDFVAIHISMYRYEFGEVIWKGRNVTTPVMHVVPHLPPLKDE